MSLVHDRTPARAVTVSEGGDHRADTLIRPHMEAPFLPFDHVSLDLETRTQRLIDMDRAADFARRSDRRRIIVRDGFGHWCSAFVHNANYLLRIHIDDCSKAIDLARPSVADTPLILTLHMRDTLATFFLSAEISGGFRA